MRKLFLVLITILSTGAIAAPPVDNTIPPCDDSIGSKKPPCSIDSESIIVPPPTPNEGENVIVPPEEPVKNVPDHRTPSSGIIDKTKPNENDRKLR